MMRTLDAYTAPFHSSETETVCFMLEQQHVADFTDFRVKLHALLKGSTCIYTVYLTFLI